MAPKGYLKSFVSNLILFPTLTHVINDKSASRQESPLEITSVGCTEN